MKQLVQFVCLMAFACFLQCCMNVEIQKDSVSASSTRVQKSDSVQIVARFINVKQDIPKYSTDCSFNALIDLRCDGNDFIEFDAVGSGSPSTEYSIRIEKVRQDSSWFVLRKIYYMRDYSQWNGNAGDNSKLMWERSLVDSTADTTMYLKMESALESFVPETTTVASYIMFDSNIQGLTYKKNDRCMYGSISNQGYLRDSPGLSALYVELKNWTREDYFKLQLLQDNNEVYAWSKLNEPVKCTVLDSAWKSVEGVHPFEFKKGENSVRLDFSKLNSNDKILCESEAGFIRNIWNVK